MSQSVVRGPIPLLKYSYALSNENVRHHVWHHDTRRDVMLFKVVRIESNVGGSFDDSSLQIVIAAGTEPLERLDTQKLVGWAREHEQRSKQGLVPPQTEHPVQVVVKFPCIAVRYPVDPPMIRRFQLKFGTEGDYLTVRDLLIELGFPLKESSGVSRPDSRASTVSQRTGLNRLANASPALSDLQRTSITPLAQPRSMLTPASSNHPRQFQSSFTSRTESSSALSMRPPGIMSPDIERVRASSAMDDINRRPSPSAGLGLQPPPPSRTLQSPPVFNQTQLGYGQQTGLQSSQMPQGHVEQPATRHLSNANGVYNSDHSQLTHSQGMPGRYSEYETMSSNVQGMSRPEESRVALNDGNVPSHYFSMGSMLRRSSTALSSQATNLQRYEPLSQLRQHSALNDSMYRPMSTPLTGSQYDMSRLDTSSWIPPKRDLPFPKPKEVKKQEATVAIARKVTFSQEDVQPIPEQRPVSPELGPIAISTPPRATKSPPPPPAKPARKRAAPRKKAAVAAVAPPKEIPDSVERVPTPVSALPQEPVSPLAIRVPPIPRPATAPPGKAGPQTRKRAAQTSIAPPAKVSRMIDSSTQTQTGSGRHHTALPRSVTVSHPTPIPAAAEEPAASSARRSAAPPQHQVEEAAPQPAAREVDNIGQQMEDFVEKFAQPRRPLEIFQLPRWDTATQNERDDMVENWMIEQLQNPQFIELCSTIQRNWQRIGIP